MAFFQTFVNVVMIVVLAVPGFVLRKCRLLPDKGASVLAVLLLYVAQPFLMMSSLINKEFAPSMLIDFAWVIFFAVVLQLLVYFIARLFFRGVKNSASRRACVACSYLGNVGFMGIPVMQMLFPGNDEMVLYTVIYNFVFNAMAWTLGVFTVTGEKKRIKPLKIILNPPTVAAIIALPFFFLNIKFPQQVTTPLSYLGNMTLPLSMVILGVRLADMHIIGRRVRESVSLNGSETVVSVSAVVPQAESTQRMQEAVLCDTEISVSDSVVPVVKNNDLCIKEGQRGEIVMNQNTVDAEQCTKSKGILDNIPVYMVAFIKLIVSPLIGLGIMLLIRLLVPVDANVISALFVIGAMPSATIALSFAEMFGGDKETAAAATLMNTILCILTIPVLMLLCSLI